MVYRCYNCGKDEIVSENDITKDGRKCPECEGHIIPIGYVDVLYEKLKKWLQDLQYETRIIQEENEKLQDALEMKQGQISRLEFQIDKVEGINERLKKVKVERYFKIKELTIENYRLKKVKHLRDEAVEMLKKFIHEIDVIEMSDDTGISDEAYDGAVDFIDRIKEWKGRIVSEEEKRRSSERVKGKWSGNNNPRHINPLKGKMNGRWEGGITNLYQFLRENITEWKEDSMIFCNYKCVLTGDYFDNIHHLTPFKDIVYEAMNLLELEIKQNIMDYTEDTRKQIINEVKDLHIKYGCGLCLCKEIHKLFHDTYNYTNFSKEDFSEFIKRYFEGEFDYKITDKHKSVNSKTNYKETIEKVVSFMM
jgi:DNA-directed RNA polymerase subunit RPC12/RpoP